MKLVAVYNVFDGIELLEGSIRQIYPECFKVLIAYQVESNFGERDDHVEHLLHQIALKYDKIRLCTYEPDLTLSGGENERNKKIIGMAAARELGATHFLLIDCDEYYRTEQFKWAKALVTENGYDSSACRLYTYFKHPTYQLFPLENYYVPFIHAIDTTLTAEYPVYADPTRTTSGKYFYEFKQHELMMHHFSWLRYDIGKKLRNSSASVNWKDKIPAFIENHRNFAMSDPMLYYPGCAIMEVENFFNIQLSQ